MTGELAYQETSGDVDDRVSNSTVSGNVKANQRLALGVMTNNTSYNQPTDKAKGASQRKGGAVQEPHIGEPQWG